MVVFESNKLDTPFNPSLRLEFVQLVKVELSMRPGVRKLSLLGEKPDSRESSTVTSKYLEANLVVSRSLQLISKRTLPKKVLGAIPVKSISKPWSE